LREKSAALYFRFFDFHFFKIEYQNIEKVSPQNLCR